MKKQFFFTKIPEVTQDYFLIWDNIAVTTTENQLILHKINTENGKYTAKKEDSLSMKESPTNFSLCKDSLIYCEKDENNDVHIAFYRSTDVRCLYMWILLNSDTDYQISTCY